MYANKVLLNSSLEQQPAAGDALFNHNDDHDNHDGDDGDDGVGDNNNGHCGDNDVGIYDGDADNDDGI